MVFTVRMTHWAVSGELREPIFSTPLSEHYFFELFRDFGDLGCPNGSQNGVRISRGNPLKSSLVPKGPKVGPRVGKWSQSAPRGCQNGAPGTPKLRF